MDSLDTNLFFEFLKILIFDALVGEQDRHEENWGIIVENGKYRLSPLYDNSCNLLREFYNEEILRQYCDGKKNFSNYIYRSRTLIYKENGKMYKHFELIEDLYKMYPKEINKEINNLKKLSDDKINNIVSRVPNGIITELQKDYIKKYIKQRRDILLNILKKECE